MSEKLHIVEALGEARLALPKLTQRALSANDRVKYLFTLLQAACDHADHPERPVPDFSAERAAAGIAGDQDPLSAASCRREAGGYRLDGAAAFCRQVDRALQEMLDPLQIGEQPGAEDFADRLSKLRKQPWCDSDDAILPAQVELLTSGNRKRGDSAHLLVMAMHKALNALQARISLLRIDGASAYDIDRADHALIAAFMRGLNRTRPLKFDHPGLGTTATRSGKRLIIQNDIGTTDAHILVVHVEKRRVTLTYTDVHMQRLRFFRNLFEGWEVHWQDTLSREDQATEDGIYHLSVGVFEARDQMQLEEYLAYLGSRIVFLIDWNRARKRLRPLLAKRAALGLLKWAADSDCGHMGFLRAGAEQVILEALSGMAGQLPASYGASLEELLGPESALSFMRYVFRASTDGLLGGRSEALIRDEIRAELANNLHEAQQDVLSIATEQACLIVELAAAVRDSLLAVAAGENGDLFARLAERAKQWEHEADVLVNRARESAHRSGRAAFTRDLVVSADDVADELEDAAFHMTLLGADNWQDSAWLEPLRSLAVQVHSGGQYFLRAVVALCQQRHAVTREDMQELLETIHRIVALERESDIVHRQVKVALVGAPVEAARLYAVAQCAGNLESAMDQLMHVALTLRDYLLKNVLEE
jgi:uncharacterized protein Yka (UPF0111/DUF47 family)